MSDWDDENDLPEFQARKPYIVNTYITQIFSMSGGSALLKLIAYDDNSYRAIFKSTFFTLQEGQTEPSKSQWNTLKKRMKRHDHRTFVFRKYGEADCRDAGDSVPATRDYDCLYIDFGFFAD